MDNLFIKEESISGDLEAVHVWAKDAIGSHNADLIKSTLYKVGAKLQKLEGFLADIRKAAHGLGDARFTKDENKMEGLLRRLLKNIDDALRSERDHQIESSLLLVDTQIPELIALDGEMKKLVGKTVKTAGRVARRL